MESLEDVDLVRSLNFSNSLTFLRLVEEELAGLVLAARAAAAGAAAAAPRAEGAAEVPGASRLAFPPLKPRYATLLQVAAARFGLRASLRGWGDERRVLVDATSEASLPRLQCTDLRLDGLGAPRLEATTRPAAQLAAPPSEPPAARLRPGPPEDADAPLESEARAPAAASQGEGRHSESEGRALAAASQGEAAGNDDGGEATMARGVTRTASGEPPKGRTGGGGLHGWGGGDDSDDDWIAKRRRASASSGRAPRGRGFADGSAGGSAAAAGEEAAGAQAGGEDDVVEFALQNDYARYQIDPDDNWSPHRKPWVEMTGAWEFSGAWSFKADEHEQWEEAPGGRSGERGGDPGGGDPRGAPRGPRGVVAWRVEHGRGGDFGLCLAETPPAVARRWLEGGQGRGEEPFLLEFRLLPAERRWEFRFGRSTSLRAEGCSGAGGAGGGWRPVPWSSEHRTSFWLAVLPGEDGKQHLLAGLDEFPERRFFFAKVRLRPQAVGFGPVLHAAREGAPFYVRDVVVFGRASLLPTPFATRDHVVEVRGLGREAAREALAGARLDGEVASLLGGPPAGPPAGPSGEPPGGGALPLLLVCRSPEAATRAAAVLAAVIAAAPGAAAPGGGGEATALRSGEWTWPPKATEEGSGAGAATASGVAAAQAHAQAARACWARLASETTRELALFQEHTLRRTQHLEGVRIARTSATRMILGSLRGPAPPPRPPGAGV